MNPVLSASACTQDGSTLCGQIYLITHNEWLANQYWLVTKPLKILLILVVAFIVRYLVRRLIDRLTTLPGGRRGGKLPAMLRPLRERAPEVLGSAVIERRRQRAKTIGSVLRSMATFLIYGLAFILVLGELGLNLGPIIASAGIIGVAIGFGAQNLVKDFLSGIFMMVEDQYGVGDVVDLGEASGKVEGVGLRVTTLRDIKGTVWYVRNGEVLRVGNSSQGYSVAVVDLPIGHDADIPASSELASRTATELTADARSTSAE